MSRINDALAAHAQRRPAQAAVCGSTLCMRRDYLVTEVDRFARQLDGTVRVLGLLLDNSPAWIVIDLAALQAGCTMVPLPGFFSDRQLRHALEDAQIDMLITDQPARIAGLFPAADVDELDVAGQRLSRFTLRARVQDSRPGIARITYTSGTTGEPRGVSLPLHALESVAESLRRAAQGHAGDRALVLLPLSILLENIGSVYAPILAGASIYVPSPQVSGIDGSSRIEPARFAAMLMHTEPSTLIVPPALLKLLVQLARAGQVPAALRFIAVGGAPVGQALLQEAAGIGLPVYQGYGLSEACSVVAVNTPGENRIGSVGRPLPHCRVRIDDNGEIRVRGTGYCGYLNGVARDSGDELHTGDSGYFDQDGFLYVTGRMNDRIVTPYGRNVDPAWVESELQAHPDILQAAVLGNGRSGLAAVLVPGPDVSAPGLVRALRTVNAGLPDYARITGWAVADAPFSTADGTLSAAGTPRRAVIGQHYAARLSGTRMAHHG